MISSALTLYGRLQNSGLKFPWSNIKLFPGVPVSSQWKKSGHYYPTQICQFALSYWSKQVLLDLKTQNDIHRNANGKRQQSDSPEPRKTVYEDGLDVQSDDWQGPTMTRVIRDSCVHFESEITLPLNNDKGCWTYKNYTTLNNKTDLNALSPSPFWLLI